MESSDTILDEHLSTGAKKWHIYILNCSESDHCHTIQPNTTNNTKKSEKRHNGLQHADEVTDLSNKELLSLVLRYVDHDTGLAREDLMDFLECLVLLGAA